MNTWTGRLSVRVASAVFAVLLISLLAVAQNSGTGERQVSGPADLADKLKRAQRLAPPSDTPIVYDAGVFACIPGQDRIAQEFVAGLVSRIQPDGGALWPVTVFEHADSGETVVLNADGAIIGRMASGGGSGTGSSTAALFCMPRLPAAAAHKHEPSRVVMTARLSASQAQNQAWAGDSGPAAGEHGLARPSAPAGFKDYLVVWNSASNVCLGGECGAAAGVSAIDAGYSHGVALHEDGSVTRIGVGSDTAGVEELRFPSAGAMLAAAGGLGDTAVLGFDGKLRHVSGAGELLGMEGDARRVRFLAASDSALLALLNNGTVFSLGTDAGLLPPEGLSGVAEIGAGSRFFGARRHNGSAVVWGDVSVATNIASGVVALSASRRGAHCLALMKDGKVVAWGDGTYGQCLVPEGLANVTAVAAGGYHSVALKRDGSVACWGLIKGAPPLLTNVVAISASYLDVCAITEDGAVAVWGRGCPLGGARLRAKTPGACEILDAKIIDCGIYMAVVRARAGLLEGDADGDGVPAVEEVFLLGTDPQVKDAGAFAVKSTGTDNTEQLSMVAVKPASVKKAAGNPSFALKTSGVTYYVDDTAGDDSNDGLSWDYPKHTIQAAVDLGQAGDTVLVAPGTYCEGTCVTPAGLFNNRLVINNGVVVKSVAGAVATIIQGSGSDYFDTSDAVRCVFITDGALDGFTLQGGAAVAHWTSADQRDKSGGCLNMGVATAESEARNCILDGGIAYDGGGVWGGRLVNCLIRNCNAYYPAGADWSVLLNCTVTANGGWYWSSCGGARSCGVTNSIISGNTGWESPECHCCRVFRSCSDASDFGNGNTAEEVLFADPLFSDAGNGDFTLLSASPCVDAGSDSSVTTSTDLLGNARIQGMAVDMGVYEMNCMDYTLSVVNGVGGGMLPWGATANVAADLSEYYVFAGWQVSPGDAYLGASFDASQPVTEVTMPDCDVTLTAEYRYPILSVNGGCGGGVLMAGETVSVFSDEPPYNYWFTGWQVSPAGTYLGGSFEASQPWTTVTMPGFDVTLTATFVERERTLTVNNGTGGGVFAVGSSVSIAAEVPQFCYFTGWQASVGYGDLGGGFDASQPGTTVTMPDCDVTLTATYMLSDSDGDGTPDIYDAFPQDASGTVDSDGDGMPDFLTGLPGSLEEDMDDDNDDMPDWWEWTYAGFNSLDSSDKYQDFDGDGLLNVEECQLSTDPWLWDSDNDGLSDSWEFLHHYDPATPEIDADADGLPDVWEIKWFGGTNVVDDADADTDGDGFPNRSELAMDTDPAFAAFAVTTSLGRHQLSWSPVPGVTNYEVSVWAGENLVRSLVTNACSVVITGNLASVICDLHVNCFDEKIGAERSAEASFIQPYIPNLRIKKVAAPFEYTPTSPLQGGELLFDQEYVVTQDSQWPKQYFLNSFYWEYCDYGLYMSGMWCEVLDENGVPYPTEWTTCGDRILVPSGTHTLRVRLFGSDSASMSECGNHPQLIEPIYLVEWSPSIVFSSAPTVETEEGSVVVVFTREEDVNQPGADFLIDYSGCPSGTFDPSQYVNPFGNRMLGDYVSTTFGNSGEMFGGSFVFPLGYIGTLQFGAEDDALGAKRICCLRLMLNRFYKSSIDNGNVKGKSFPLTTSSLRSAFANGAYQYGSGSLTEKEIGFVAELTGDDPIVKSLVVEPSGPVFWPTRSSALVATAQSAFSVVSPDAVMALSSATFSDDCEHPSTNLTFQGSVIGSCDGPCDDDQDEPCDDDDCYEDYPKPDDDDDCGCNNSDTDGPSGRSVAFRLSLGKTGANTVAGMVWFEVEGDSVGVCPGLFSVLTNNSVAVSQTENGGVLIECSQTGGRSVLISPEGEGQVRLLIHEFLDTGWAPVGQCWVIANEGDTQHVRFRKYLGGESIEANLREDVLFSYDYANALWAKVDAMDGNACETVKHEGDLATDGWTKTTRLHSTVAGNTLRLSGAISSNALVGAVGYEVPRQVMSAEWDGLSQTWLETFMSYWAAAGNTKVNGKPKFRRSPYNGEWKYWAYDSFGRETFTAEPLNGAGAPTELVAGEEEADLTAFAGQPGLEAKVTESLYEGAETGSFLDFEKPRTVVGYVIIQAQTAPVMVSCAWHTYARELSIDNYSLLRHRVIRAASASAEKDAPGNTWTETLAYADEIDSTDPLAPEVLRGRMLREEGSDGTLTTWSYASGTYGNEAAFTIVSRRGTTTLCNGVANKSTYEVEVVDAAFGRTLRRETRLYTGGTPDQDPVLSWETRVYDEKGRLVTTSYSDGTSDHNEWGCCKIESSVGRDGSSRSFSYDPNGHRTVTFDEAIGQLPGTEGSYPFTEICTDALGRETNSVRAVTGGTMAFLPLVTQTEYPNGTGRFRVTTDPIGGQSVSLRYYLNDGAEVSDTIASGVTNRIVRKAGGETVEKKIWVDPVTGTEKWTQKTRSTTWLADGRRVEAVVFAASDRAPYEKSVTVYDFLGQVVSETTPLFEVANTYANGRLIRTDRSNGPTILYTYDSLGNRVDTSTDADENGSVNYDGTDPITRTLEGYEVRDGQVWHVTSNLVWNAYGQNVCLPTSVSRDRLTGLGTVGSGAPAGASLMTAQSETEDWRGNITRTTTYANPSTRTQWKVTDTPESAIDAVVQSVAGRPVQLLSSTGIDSAYAYDGFGRQIAFIDGRSNGHATFYNDVGLVSVTGTFPYTAPLSEYFNPGSPLLLSRMAFAYDGLGRRISSTNALEQVTQMAYDPLGNVIAQWGATYPVVYEYDTAGRKVAMATTRDTNQSSGNLLNLLPAGVALSDTAHTAYPVALDTTRWTYQPSTGLLVSKIYADGTGPTYTYTDEGRLATRTWARGVVTTYGYNTLGQLVAVDYSDATPDVSYTYDRLGRQLSAVSSVSAVSYSYSGFDLISESQNGVTLSSNHDSLGRVETMNYSPQGLYYGYYEELRVYDDYGRLSSINVHSPYNTALSGTTPYDSSFDYAYLAGTDTPQSMTAWHWSEYLDENENWVPQVSQTLAWSRSYESARDLMTGVENSFGGQPVSTFTYVNDALGRRMQRTDFDGSVYKANSFAYNQRSEVTLAHMDNTFYNYGYDPIGNRCFALANGEATAYTANAVNQYTAITGGSPSSPNYDADGNMLTCALQTGEWHFFWDGENRLITASNATTMVRNAYDHQSRRIRKEVSAFNASTSNFEPVTSHFFLWDGWNPLCESVTPATASMNPADVFSYTWGLDLAGSKQGAGGVGGLLAEYAPSVEWIGFGEVYYPAYDANGNVTTYLDAIGTSAGRFEYDAFGSTISGNVDAGLHLPFRFSTKYAGEETGMCNYGYRFYHPGLSRWVSRDPIGERGGNNLFGFVNNNSVNNVDDLGLVVTDNVTKHGGVPRDKFNELYKQYSLRVAPRNVVGACKAYILASFLPKGAGCDASCSQIVVRHDTSVEGGVFWLEGEDVSTENHEMRHVQHALDSADAFDKLLHLFEGKCVKDKCARARGRYLEASLKFVTAVQENNDNRLEFEDYGNEYPDTGADYGDSYRELASAREVFEDAKTKMKEACK